MARVGLCIRAAGNLSYIARRRICPALISLVSAMALCWPAAARDAASSGAVRLGVEAPAADPQQFLGSLVLLAAGVMLISWLSRTLAASRTPWQGAVGRDRAIAMLRRTEDGLAELTLVSPVGVMLINGDGECLYSNGRFQRMTDRRHRDLAGAGWLDGVHPDDREGILLAWREAAASGRPFRLEFRLCPPRGGELWVLGQAETHHGGDRNGSLRAHATADRVRLLDLGPHGHPGDGLRIGRPPRVRKQRSPAWPAHGRRCPSLPRKRLRPIR